MLLSTIRSAAPCRAFSRLLLLLIVLGTFAGRGITSVFAQTLPVSSPSSILAPESNLAVLAKHPILMIYRAAPDKLGTRDTVSALIFGDHSGATLHLRLIHSNGRSQIATNPVRGSDSDTEPLWSQWISPAIPINFYGWHTVTVPVSQFVYRAPIGQTASSSPAPSPTNADTFGVDMTSVGENVMVDNIVWSTNGSIPAVAPVVVDDFETGNFAAWQEHGTPETTQAANMSLVFDNGRVKQGRVALSINFSADKLAHKLALAQVNLLLKNANQDWLAYVPKSPFRRILPTSMPQPGEISAPLNVFACAGQSESASFCIYADKELADVSVVPSSDLHDVANNINRSAIDVRVVKVWDRPGIGKYVDYDAAGQTPELLMKDDRQPLVFTAGNPPQVRLVGNPTTTISERTVKQFWVTVHVPKTALPGHYNTQLNIVGTGVQPGSVSLSLEVLPINLSSPSKQYAVGLRSRVCTAPATLPSADGHDLVTDFIDPDTLNAQLADISGHGIQFATLCDPPSSLWSDFAAYRGASLSTPLMYAGLTGDSDKDMAAAAQIDSERAQNGVDSVAFVACPADLPSLYKSKKTTAAFVHSSDEFDAEKDSLDMPIYSVDEPYVQTLLRTSGKRTSDKHDYWYWPAFENDPQANRLYAGYLLFRANLYGAYLPDYQTCTTDDPYAAEPTPDATGDAAMLRPAMLTYPVKDGVLDTIQWEAVQAGVNDMRYLTTFYSALRECKDNHVAKPLVAAFEPQVKSMMSKAFWVLDDTEYQKARRSIAHDTVLMRKQLDAFYAGGGGNLLNANAPTAAVTKKVIVKKSVSSKS